LPKFRRRNEIGNLPASEIAPFIVAAEHIADGDIGAPSLIEAGNHIRSDKPGPAGDQQHRCFKTGLKDRSGPLPIVGTAPLPQTCVLGNSQ
jgi:hypothetical protein